MNGYDGDLITTAREGWLQAAERHVATLIGRRVDFTQEDVAALGVGEPTHPNMWGQLLLRHAKRGVIECVGYIRSTKKSRKGGSIRVWRAVGNPLAHPTATDLEARN